MKASEYFGDWMDVIDTVELRRLISVVDSIYEDFDEAEVEFIKDMLQ